MKKDIENKRHSTLVLVTNSQSLKIARKGLNIVETWGKTECFSPKR